MPSQSQQNSTGKTAYAEAVKSSTVFIANGLESRSAVSLAHNSQLFFFWEDVVLTRVGLDLIRNQPAKLFKLTLRDPYNFEGVRLALGHVLEAGEELSEEAHRWLVQYLKGEITQPPRKQGKTPSVWLHFLIQLAVENLVYEYKFEATRNDETSAISACDVVAEAMRSLKQKPATFSSIKRIWIKRDMRKYNLFSEV